MIRTSHQTPATRRRRAASTATVTLLSCAFALGLLSITSTAAHAQEEVALCSFLEIQASNDGEGVDEKLKPLKKKLKRPPFSSWTKFVLLRQQDKKLTLNQLADLQIGQSSKLAVLYKEYAKGKKERFKLRLTLHLKNGKQALGTDFTVNRGDYLLISISPKPDNGFVLAFTCQK